MSAMGPGYAPMGHGQRMSAVGGPPMSVMGPGYAPMAPYSPSPPLGTPPPGQALPHMHSSGSSNVIVALTVIAFVLAILAVGFFFLISSC
jgi:hypothetical protein